MEEERLFGEEVWRGEVGNTVLRMEECGRKREVFKFSSFGR